MNRTFLLNVILLIGANFLVKPFYVFGIDRTVQNTVGTAEYGLFFVLFNMAFLFQIINDFGLQNFNSRAVAQDHTKAAVLFPHIVLVKIVFGLLFLACISMFAIISGYQAFLWPMVIFIGINHVLNSFNLYLRSNVVGLGYYKTDSLFSILDKVLMICICGYLLWFAQQRSDFDIMWFIYSQTASFLIAMVFILGFVISKAGRLTFHIKFDFLKKLLKESAPYALVVFLMTMYTRIDAYMIEQLLEDGAHQAGIYAAGYRVLDAVNMIGFLFAGLLLPMFSKLLKAKQSIALHDLTQTGIRLIWFGAIPLSLLCFYYRGWIIEVLYPAGDMYWSRVFGWLILTFIAVTGTYIYGTLLTANASLRKMNIIFCISIVANIILNFILIKSHKAEGAAIATLITQMGAFLLQLGLAHKTMGIGIDKNNLVKFIAYGFMCLLIGYGIFHILEFHNLMGFFISIVLSLMSGIILKLFDYQQFVSLLSKKVK